MISLTESAVAAIAQLQNERAQPGQFLRLKVEPGGCSGFEYAMGFFARESDDVVIEQGGVTLLVDPASADYLDGSTIDFDDGLQGKGFDIRNPNAQSTCGCGRSFS
jgi:iron-sulfur cluster assembly protein/iron-sulfur cluster insertion protein